jgi:hypothetical protein
MNAERPSDRAVPRAAPGLALAALALLQASACHDITEPPNTPVGVTALQVPDSAFADGASLVLVSATVDSRIAVTNRDVKFRTTAGAFNGAVDITVPADSLGVARTFLKAPADSAVAIVSATASTGTRTALLRFVRAYPESLMLQPGAFALTAGVTHQVEVTAVLRRATGIPTRGAVVAFTANDSTGAARGAFSAVPPSDAAGNVGVRYTSPDTAYAGRVTIHAAVRNASGAILADSAVLQIVPPPKPESE